MAKKVTDKRILEHFKKAKIIGKIQDLMSKEDVHSLGLKFKSIRFSKLDGGEDVPFCTDSKEKVVDLGNGQKEIQCVCLAWSDGQDHGTDC